MSTPEQTRGHLIVRTAPEAFLRALAGAGEGNPGYEAYVRTLWAALPGLAPRRYRGIDRDPLQPLFETDVETDLGVGPDWVAKVRMREGVRPRSDDPSWWRLFDPDVVEDPALARDVAARTDRPEEWEVVAVSRDDPGADARTLGFDVATWGGDHFSAVLDAMLVPRRRPPDPSDFDTLRSHAKRLNEHQLFPSWEDAAAYRAWHRTRPWAERESEDEGAGELHVVRVDAAP